MGKINLSCDSKEDYKNINNWTFNENKPCPERSRMDQSQNRQNGPKIACRETLPRAKKLIFRIKLDISINDNYYVPSGVKVSKGLEDNKTKKWPPK
jgi:hypothetical protein